MRILCVLFVLILFTPFASPPLRAETICRCECFRVAGGKVCRRHCYNRAPFGFDAGDDNSREDNYVTQDDASEPEVEEEEPQRTNLFATEDETPDASDPPDVEAGPEQSVASERPTSFDASEPSRASLSDALDPNTRALICRVFWGGLGFLVAFSLWSSVSHLFSIARTRRDIALTGRHTRSARQIEQRLRDAARDADAFIDSYRRHSYRRGYDE